MRLLTAIAAIAFFACKAPAKTNNLLDYYARIDTAKKPTYLTYYATAQKLPTSATVGDKIRAYHGAALLQADANTLCREWDCVSQAFDATKEKNRSALFSYAAFHLAELATSDAMFNTALTLLSHTDDAPEALARKISLLKGKILQQSQTALVKEHYHKHIEKFNDAESLYFAAAAFEKQHDITETLKIAFRVLEKPEADFPFSQSGILIRNILHRKIYELPNNTQRIRLMEALRVAKDKASAKKLYETLDNIELSKEDSQLFTYYASRLLVGASQFQEAARLLQRNNALFFTNDNDKAVLDICERFLKKKQFNTVEDLFTLKNGTKGSVQCLLRSRERQGQYDATTRAIAKTYIENFDSESTLAERLFLRSCLPNTPKHSEEISLSCLEELRGVTSPKSDDEKPLLGASARYYLAREYDRQGALDKARVLLIEIGKHYNDDFYFYRLLENPLRAQSTLLHENESLNERNIKIFTALQKHDLSAARGIKINSTLTDIEEAVKERMQNLTDTEKIALLLFAADSRSEARELIRSDNKLDVYRSLMALGAVASKPDIALYGVRLYLREKKMRPFLFEIPPFLRDLLYPQTYSAYVEKYGKMRNIEPAAILALIRQESHFFPGARSHANAQGLMQLLPSTAKLVAKKEKLAHYDLYNPEVNIRLGTAFMQDVMGKYSSDFTHVAISYNAGPGRYLQWIKKYSNDSDIFIEEIPFRETYSYVRILLTDRIIYRALLGKND
ncbi:MAG TPA: lytic transglycosylase domain-containing protein [Turneriella sp.]|nr:lytic transglycosylase domain-containing protein [Turneriella sp.]